ATTGKPEEKMAARRALVSGVLDSAWIYATARAPGEDIDFTKFKAFLFDPLDEKQGESVAKILLQKDFILPDAFDDYETLITQASAIANVMKKTGPQSVEKLKDKGALLSNILVRGLGAISANVALNRLKGVVGNVPGASMSVAQTTSNATAELGLNMPAMKVQDIFTEAMLYPNVTKILLAPPPKTESAARRFFGSIPAIFYTSGVRGVTEAAKQTETGPIPTDYVEEVYREVVPQPQPEPQPEPTAPEPRTTGPLSVVNNNPGNLRLAGQPGAIEGEGGFAAFASPGQGLRALTRQVVLDTQTRDMSLEDFLNKYAPPSENETNKYISFVERQTGLDAKGKVPESRVPQLVRAIVRMEGGQEAVDYFYGEQRAEAEASQRPPLAQAAPPPMPPAPPSPAPLTPQSLQRTAQVLGPNDEIGRLASELMMRQGPA
ncbi:MAG: hypothetical protein ACPH3H_09260, partial [Pseudomonadales bacterium]